ncbi:hypothetical protein Ahy_B01g052882 [Arachis hypogaea]|uniref:Uncharacterized protein n=1 Tax=Arachis hypogaea TaxID=3818 RepID=A0A445AQN9_ARAHY|nr:hypothetical protein Ahy_B01g052882 [Arachis hypogaea]
MVKNCLAFYFIHEKIYWFVWLLKGYGMPQSWTRLAIIHCHSLLIGSELQPLYIWENTLLMEAASTLNIVLCNLDNGGLEFSLVEPTPLDVSMGFLVSPLYRCLGSSSSKSGKELETNRVEPLEQPSSLPPTSTEIRAVSLSIKVVMTHPDERNGKPLGVTRNAQNGCCL